MTLAIRSPFRMTLATLAALAAMLAATGIVQIEAFQYPSNLKYALTILAPLAVFLACTIERPLWLFSGAMIVAAPFMSENAQFAGMRVSVIVPLLLASANGLGAAPAGSRWRACSPSRCCWFPWP